MPDPTTPVVGLPPAPNPNYSRLLDAQTRQFATPKGDQQYYADPTGNIYEPFGSYDDYLRADQIQKYVRAENQD